MKKYFLLILTLVFWGLSANAQTGTSANIYGMSVDYYNHGSKTGHLVFHNNTGIEQTHVHVTVTVTIIETVKFAGIPVEKKTKELVLCDDYFDVPVGNSKFYRGAKGEVKGGPEKEGKEYRYYVNISDFSTSIHR